MVLEQTEFNKHSVPNSNNICTHAIKESPLHQLILKVTLTNSYVCVKKAGKKRKNMKYSKNQAAS